MILCDLVDLLNVTQNTNIMKKIGVVSKKLNVCIKDSIRRLKRQITDLKKLFVTFI